MVAALTPNRVAKSATRTAPPCATILTMAARLSTVKADDGRWLTRVIVSRYARSVNIECAIMHVSELKRTCSRTVVAHYALGNKKRLILSMRRLRTGVHTTTQDSVLSPVILPIVGEIHPERFLSDDLQFHTARAAFDHGSFTRPIHAHSAAAVGTARL
jgi:hypothetical protein